MLSQGYKGLRNQVTHVHVTALQTAGSARSDLDRVRDRVPNRFGLGKQKVPTTLVILAARILMPMYGPVPHGMNTRAFTNTSQTVH